MNLLAKHQMRVKTGFEKNVKWSKAPVGQKLKELQYNTLSKLNYTNSAY